MKNKKNSKNSEIPYIYSNVIKNYRKNMTSKKYRIFSSFIQHIINF